MEERSCLHSSRGSGVWAVSIVQVDELECAKAQVWTSFACVCELKVGKGVGCRWHWAREVGRVR